jgi:hypothetical protein
MTNTSWRDDFRRVEPGRATAYSLSGEAWVQDMPFENAHAAGGLLTTVGDLLRWNSALDEDALGPGITARLQEQAALADGRRIAYGRGLFIERHRGAEELGHGGVTSGYRAWTARYPAHRLAVAVLCNSGEVNPAALGRAIADAYLPPELASLPPHEGGAAVDRAERSAPPGRQGERWNPGAADLAALAGRYASDEIGAVYALAVEEGRLVLRIERRPSLKWILAPTVQDSFVFPGGRVRVLRDAAGAATQLLVSTERVRDLPFGRTAQQSGAGSP